MTCRQIKSIAPWYPFVVVLLTCLFHMYMSIKSITIADRKKNWNENKEKPVPSFHNATGETAAAAVPYILIVLVCRRRFLQNVHHLLQIVID